MISPAILKGVASYLNSMDAKAAVFTEDMQLQWTNCKTFFSNFDIEALRNILPIKTESLISVSDEDTKSAMTVVPIYKSKRIITGYICIIHNSYQVYSMIKNSSVSDFSSRFLEDCHKSVTNIIGINKSIEDILENEIDTHGIRELIDRQYDDAVELSNDISLSEMLYLQSSELDSGFNCDISSLLSTMCNEISTCIASAGRSVDADIDIKSYYARINYKDITLALSELLRYHMCLSPLKSNIRISSGFSDGNYCINIETDLLPKDEMKNVDVIKAQYEREIARRIITDHCDGSISFNLNGKTAVSVIKFPVVKKNRGAILNSKNAEYIFGSYRPLRSLISDAVAKEADELVKIEEIEQKIKKADR